MTATPARRFERPQRIRFGHCDPAGIVFFPQYLVMLNGLVEDWFTDGLGIPYAQLLGARRVGLPTVSLQVDFSAISRMGDDVVLGLAVERAGTSSLTLALDCRADIEQRVRARQVLVFTSLDSHRAIAMPPDVRQALAAFTRPLDATASSQDVL
jgi:4-hydroxybenzoyl-CoA thioesterase